MRLCYDIHCLGIWLIRRYIDYADTLKLYRLRVLGDESRASEVHIVMSEDWNKNWS